MIDYLDSHEIDINISEAKSLVGAIKNLVSEGSGDRDHVTSSMTDLTPEGVSMKYSQIGGVEVNGVKSESTEILAHELTHAQDILNGNHSKDSEAVRSDKSISVSDREGAVRDRMEKRAMKSANILRIKRGKPIRTKYLGKKLINQRRLHDDKHSTRTIKK